MIIQVPKADLPDAKPGDPITLTGQVTADNGDMLELDVDAQAAPAAAQAPASFDEMESEMKAETRAI